MLISDRVSDSLNVQRLTVIFGWTTFVLQSLPPKICEQIPLVSMLAAAFIELSRDDRHGTGNSNLLPQCELKKHAVNKRSYLYSVTLYFWREYFLRLSLAESVFNRNSALQKHGFSDELTIPGWIRATHTLYMELALFENDYDKRALGIHEHCQRVDCLFFD